MKIIILTIHFPATQVFFVPGLQGVPSWAINWRTATIPVSDSQSNEHSTSVKKLFN